MATFVSLTRSNGQAVWINLELIVGICLDPAPAAEQRTMLIMPVDNQAFHVKETPEEIFALAKAELS